MTSWQSTLKDTSSIMRYLLETGTLSDVTFLVGCGPNKKSFNAHKLVLAARSEVFEKMFFGALPEKGEKIEIPDVSPDIFEIMLKFIYEDTLGAKSMEEAIETYAVAHKYNITELMHLLSNYMKEILNPKNVSLVYQMSSIYGDEDLKFVCTHIVIEKPEETIQSETFTEISFEMVESMLEIISVNISSHFLLFDSLIKWAEAEQKRCPQDEPTKNVRQLMDPFLPKIKFLSMSFEEFTRGPGASGIFSDNEIARILMNMSITNSAVLPDWCNKEKKLKEKVLPALPVSRLERVVLYKPGINEEFPSNLIQCPRVTKFKSPFHCHVLCGIGVVGKSILLKGLTISTPCVPLNSIFFKINNIRRKVDISISPISSDKETTLMLKKPFLFQRGINYEIKVDAKTPVWSTYYVGTFDIPLPSNGHLLIRQIPGGSDLSPSHISELFYSECD